MQPVSIAPSARKHGIADEDMLHAWRNQLGARYYDDGLTMVVGPDGAGNLLEVGIAETPDEGLVIIHTMQAQRKTLRGVLGR